MTARQAEDQRRIWWNLVNTDWLFTSITCVPSPSSGHRLKPVRDRGRTYSAVSADGHDVNLPSPLVERGEDDPEARQAVQALAFRSILMGQLRRMSNWNLRRGVSESEVRKLEADIDRMETKLPECCRIDVDDYRSAATPVTSFWSASVLTCAAKVPRATTRHHKPNSSK